MKKYISPLIFLVICSARAYSQDVTVTYSTSVNNYLDTLMGDMLQYGYYKDEKMLSETRYSDTRFSKTLITAEGSLFIMNEGGRKTFFKGPPGIKKAAAPTAGITYIDSTKQIAGYICKEALVKTGINTVNGNGYDVVWYTEQLHLNSLGLVQDPFWGVKGVPLEFIINAEDMKFTLTATAVSTTPIPDSVFQVSTKGYKKIDIKKG